VVVAAGCSALVVAAVVRPPARIDLLLGLVGAALVYAAERWRSDRAARANRLAAAHAFRRLVDRVSAVDPAPSDEVAATDAPSRPAGDPSPVLEQEGDVWRITYAGVTIRVRHSRGLALLSHLLRRPGEELHVQTLDLLVPSAGAAGERLPVDPDALPQDGMSLGLGDAGPVIDDRARAEYRRRLADLRAELDDAERCNDPGRAAAARAEAEQLGEELRAAAGLHGRTRRMSSDVDRMRIAVTRRIRAAIEHLGKLHPALGDHLERSVRTGFACCYAPGAGPERALR
jgi:non-specific serine/threonine protein kinase